jgi:hypothetical protein
MRGKLMAILVVSTVAAAIRSAAADPGVLSPPALYDNAGGGFGQLFEDTQPWISGVEFYIGDPTRPNNTTVNALTGVAYIDLYDATNLQDPVLLEESQVQDATGSSFGITTFNLDSPIMATIGGSYMFAINTADVFGLGLSSQTNSTYGPGYETAIEPNGSIGKAGGNDRDTSFLVLNQPPVPEPSSIALLLATSGFMLRRKRSGRKNTPHFIISSSNGCIPSAQIS